MMDSSTLVLATAKEASRFLDVTLVFLVSIARFPPVVILVGRPFLERLTLVSNVLYSYMI